MDKINKIPTEILMKLMENSYLQPSGADMKVEIKALHSNILIQGYYIKLARFLS